MTEWHPPVPQLEAWVAGSVDMVEAASIEQHVPACEKCRVVVASCEGLPLPDTVWDSIVDGIELQPLNLAGRALTAVGMSPGNAFLVSSAPSLSTAWILGISVTLLFAVLAAAQTGTRGIAFFLLLAPLLPLAGIALSFGSEADPLFELTLAAPYSNLRLLLWRSAAVLAATIPITVIGALIVSADWWVAAVWLFPAFAFSAVTLASTRWFDPQYAATGLAIGWILLQGNGLRRGEALAVLSTDALILYVIVGLVATVVFLTRGRTERFAGRLP